MLKFNAEKEQYLANTDANELLNKIKLKLKDYKKQYVDGKPEELILFGYNETKKIEDIIYDSLESWSNDISSLSVNDIKAEFAKYKNVINNTNNTRIKTNITKFADAKIDFEPDYHIGFEIFDKLLGLHIPKDKILSKFIRPEYDEKLKAVIEEKIDAFIKSIKVRIFTECRYLNKTDILLQDINDFSYNAELSLFDLVDVKELEALAIKSGAIYQDVLITKEEFETSISVHMKKLTKSINECIEKSGKNKSDFKYLIMTGGSSRVPLVRKTIKSCFDDDIKVVCEDLSSQKDVENHQTIKNIDTPDDISVGLCMYALNIFS